MTPRRRDRPPRPRSVRRCRLFAPPSGAIPRLAPRIVATFSATCATRWARRAERPRRRGRRRFVRSRRRRREGGSSPPPPPRAPPQRNFSSRGSTRRVVAEGEGAWEARALAAAASELVEMDDPALAPAVTALASSRATADPAAVVDAILLGRLVPHADAVAEDDVKTRLPAWTPRGVDSERVRGVSRANEDRLRRWATAWTRDAYASAESLLAKGGGRADESAYASAGRAKTTRVRNPPPILSRASSNRRRVRPRFPCPRTCSGSSRRSRRNARGSRRARNGARRVSRGWAGEPRDVQKRTTQNASDGNILRRRGTRDEPGDGARGRSPKTRPRLRVSRAGRDFDDSTRRTASVEIRRRRRRRRNLWRFTARTDGRDGNPGGDCRRIFSTRTYRRRLGGRREAGSARGARARRRTRRRRTNRDSAPRDSTPRRRSPRESRSRERRGRGPSHRAYG